MKLRLARNLEQLNSSYWFFPTLMAVGAILTAAGMIYLDRLSQSPGAFFNNGFFVISPSGARSLLSTVSSSAISVTGVVFSITILVLSMASAQFGPQLLGNFMQHRGTQVVLGAFVGTFVYCLIVLSAVRNDEMLVFVPNLSVGLGLLLGILSFGLLIYFIHHVSVFIQASRVISDVGERMEASVSRAFPERDSGSRTTPDEEDAGPIHEKFASQGCAARSTESGYLQMIDWEALCRVAADNDLMLEMTCRPGHYIVEGEKLVLVLPQDRTDDKILSRICGALLLGPERIPPQDPEFAVHQLLQVALRALSPGINDPYTAINCIDRLSAALAHLAERQLPSRYLLDKQGKVRVINNPYTYGGIVNTAFDQLRQHAAGNAAVTFRLLEVAATLGEQNLPPPFREALERQVYAIGKLNEPYFACQIDREGFADRYEHALKTVARSTEA